ncbi:hypothetical protein AB0A63_40525 [Lentzea sp. NPDC042327]|uniref:hypothetical protein n=1 Tax=Lentzea sp. NPDC042327 TaxID=3154801 RepID=UPI0033CD2881
MFWRRRRHAGRVLRALTARPDLELDTAALAEAAALSPARLYPVLVRLRRLNQVATRWAATPGRSGRQLHRATVYGRWVSAEHRPRFVPSWPADGKTAE